jgi:hypothetical protein
MRIDDKDDQTVRLIERQQWPWRWLQSWWLQGFSTDRACTRGRREKCRGPRRASPREESTTREREERGAW